MATSKFGKAFAAARKAGKKEFSFGGKKYNTKTRDEDAPKNVPTPTANPAKAKSGASRSTDKKVAEKSGASRSTDNKVVEKKPRAKLFTNGKSESYADRNKRKSSTKNGGGGGW